MPDTADLTAAVARYSEAVRCETEPARIALAQQGLAKVYYRLGNLLAAEKTYLAALKTLAIEPAAHEQRASITLSLSAIYVQSGQFSRGESYIRELLASPVARSAADTAGLNSALGLLLMQRQQLNEAERVLKVALAICADCQELKAVTIGNLGDIEALRGDLTGAAGSYRDALAILHAIPSPPPVPLAVTLVEYAGVLLRQGYPQTSEAYYREGLAVAEARLGSDHAVIAVLLEKTARMLRGTGRTNEAKGMEQRAKQIRTNSTRVNLAQHSIDWKTLELENVKR